MEQYGALPSCPSGISVSAPYGLEAYNQPRATAKSILGGALVGGASNFITPGGPLARAALGAFGNLAQQATNPCFNGFAFSQAAAAGALKAYGIGERFPTFLQPNLLSNTQYVAHEAATQFSENIIVDAAK